MIRGGLSYRVAHRGMHALSSMALGFVNEPFSPPAEGSSSSDAAAEIDALDPAMIAAMADVFPHTAAMVAEELHAESEAMLGWCDSQTEFEFTLGLLLDGLGPGRPIGGLTHANAALVGPYEQVDVQPS